MFVFISVFAMNLVAPILPAISSELHIEQPAVQEMVLSIFLLGFAFGPLIASPLSETYGRIRVIQSWNMLYTIFNAVCGASQSKEALIVLRFISGVFASATLGVSRIAILRMAHANCFRLGAELSATYSDPRIAVKVSLYTAGARWPVHLSASSLVVSLPSTQPGAGLSFPLPFSTHASS